jgi:DMSO/TMAO reductase YedYZ molybdopterin-dependent catalytic subunit
MFNFEGSDRKKEETRLYSENRLPPGQSLTLKFPVLHYGAVPTFEPATWDFRVWGEVEQEKTWTWGEFNHLPHSKVKMDIHCVTRWSKADTVWEGVAVRTLLESGLVRLKPAVHFVMQHAEFGFTVNIPLEVALQDNFLLATHFNGEPITPEHGFPLRGVVGAIPDRPDLKSPYLWKGAKWLRALEFMSRDRLGFWEQAGYSNSADVWKEERFEYSNKRA